MNMNVNDRFTKIRDYIDCTNIVDEIETFLGADDLADFCDHLEESYDLDFSEDDMYNEEDY